MKDYIVKVMGMDYKLKFCTSKEQPKFKSLSAAGLCEPYERTLYINIEDMGDEDAFADVFSYIKQVIRHEVMHAMFFECGLTDYMRDEILVEFLACAYPKMEETLEHCKDIVDGTKFPWEGTKEDRHD